MPTFGTSVYPTSGTVITRAYAVANINDPINWLRALTGGADPPAADRVVVSTSTTATAWVQIPTGAYADGSITNVKLALQKVEAASPLAATFGGLLGTNKSGFYVVGAPADGPVAGRSYYCINIGDFTNPLTYNGQIAVDNLDPTQMFIRNIIAGSGTAWHKVWNDGNDGVGSGLDADTLDGVQGSGYAPIAQAVPSGAIVAFETLAELTAAGAAWARYTAADGRLLIGAGTTFSQTFAQATSYGANWTPFAGAAVISSTAADVTGAPAAGSAFSAPSHQHTVTIAAQTWLPVARGIIWGRHV